MPSIRSFQKQKAVLKKRQQELWAQQEPIKKELTTLYEDIKKIDEQIDSELAQAIDVEKEITPAQWKWLLDGRHNSDAQSNLQKMVLKKYALHTTGMYWSDSNQAQIQLGKQYWNGNIEVMLEAIKVVGPHVAIRTVEMRRPQRKLKGHYFGIQDGDLSKYGINYLLVDPTLKTAYYMQTTYGDDRIIDGPTPLRECLTKAWKLINTSEDEDDQND